MGKRVVAYGPSEWREDLRLNDRTTASGRPPLATGLLEIAAQDVVLAKADAVSAAMILLAALRMRMGKDWREADIRCTAAAVQKTTAVSDDDFRRQAAHLLPGNLTISGDDSWDVAERTLGGRAGQRHAAHLQMLFADTLDLPACFNVADSQAEGSDLGLKPAFAEAVRVMGRHLDPARPGQQTFRDGIAAGLGFWFHGTDAIYGHAARQKWLRARDPGLGRPARERRVLEARVLAEYQRSARIANPLRHIEHDAGLRALIAGQVEVALGT